MSVANIINKYKNQTTTGAPVSATSVNMTVGSGVSDIIKKYKQVPETTQEPETQVDTNYNKGGVLGGVGYVGTNLGAGILGVGEGIFDYLVGGGASLIGQHEFAKSLHENDIAGGIQQRAAERFNPSGGWEFAGNVASGVGQTSVGIAAAAALTLATGGAAAPLAGKIAVGTIALGAAGRSTTSAYQQTGELGLKEYSYGALSGGVEGALEAFSGAAGKVATRAVSPLAKTTAKTAVRKGVVKTMISDGAGEFVEEGLSEIIDPYLQRFTGVNKEAENATLNEIVYAGLVGFVSGGITSGVGGGVSSARNLKKGAAIQSEGKADTRLQNARALVLNAQQAQDMSAVSEPMTSLIGSLDAYSKMENKSSVRGKMLLGEIDRTATYIELSNGVNESRQKILENAEQVALMAQKQGQNITAEQIRNDKQILTNLAVADFAGQLMSDPVDVTSRQTMSEANYQSWVEGMDADTKAEASRTLGVDIDSAGYYEVMQAIQNYTPDIATETKSAAQIAIENAQSEFAELAQQGDILEVTPGKEVRKQYEKLPDTVTLNDGESKVYRADNGNIIAVKRDGDSYIVAADGADGKGIGRTARPVSQAQLNDVLATLSQADFKRPTPKQTAQKAEVKPKTKPEPKAPTRQSTTQATETARKYVKDFDMLSRDRRGKIVEAITTGEQHGVDSRTLNAIANIIAIRDVGISFADVGENGIYTTIDGNRVAVINPNAKAVREAILHELTHDMEDSAGYHILASVALENATTEDRNTIKGQYKKFYAEHGMEISDKVLDSEITAHYLAEQLDNSNFLDRFVNEQKTFLQKMKRWLSSLANRANRSEAAQLSRAVKMVEKVYDAVLRVPSFAQAGGAIRSAIMTDKQYGKIAYIDSDQITVKEGETYAQAVKRYFDTHLKGMDVEVVSTGQGVGIRQSKKYLDRKSSGIAQKRGAVQILDDIISIGENHKHRKNLTEVDGNVKKHLGLSAERGWDYYDTKFLVGNDIYSARVVIRKSGDGVDYFYDLDHIKKEATRSAQELNPKLLSIATSTTSIRQNSEKSTPKTKKDTRYSLTMEQARNTNTKLDLPRSQEFLNAVKNTSAAEITSEGLVIDVIRKQSPEQSGELSVRKGVFYLVSGDKRISYYGGKTGYGGNEIHTGKTLFKRPLFVKGATGGKAPQSAFTQLRGKAAFSELENSIFSVINQRREFDKIDAVTNLIEGYGIDYDSAYDDAYNIVTNSTVGNTLRYATQEYIIGEVARQEGYDSIIGYSTDRSGNEFISEIFDLREKTYPSYDSESTVNEEYINEDNTRYSLSDTDSQGRKLSKEQREYFKDSKVRDEQGRLLEVYHGTDADFTMFDKGKIGKNFSDSYGGFYFTNKESSARYYAGREGKTGSYYLDFKNPRILNADSGWFNGADYFDINAYSHVEQAIENKYDGIIVNHKNGSLYLAFEPNQIKLTTNLNPTASEDIRYSLSRYADRILHAEKTERPKQSLKSEASSIMKSLRIALVDEFAGVADVGAKLGIKDIEATIHAVRTGRSTAHEMLAYDQYDLSTHKRVGKGLGAIMQPINTQGKREALFDYLTNKHDIDRIAQDKGIFTDSDAEYSKKFVEQVETNHPEIVKVANELYRYIRNLNKMMVDAGLASQEMIDHLQEIYPHYIPMYRNADGLGIAPIQGKSNIRVNQPIQRAKGGSDIAIKQIDQNIADLTLRVVQAAKNNQLITALYDAAVKNKDFTDIEVVERRKLDAEEFADFEYDATPKKNQATFYHKGEQVTVRVSPDVYAGLNRSMPDFMSNPAMKFMERVNTSFKRLVTSLNPAFMVRNALRDIQEAGIYSKYGLSTFGKNYGRAASEIKNNGELWRLYRAAGGLGSSFYDLNSGEFNLPTESGFTKSEGNVLAKPLIAMENANVFVEQLPRLSEFISSIEAGNSVEQAILDSADVTTNFGRSGKITRILNRTLVPFLNPSIQGFSKLVRTVTATRTMRAFSQLAFRAAMLGILPQLLNELMYQDDEDYRNLRATDKENNYLLKVGDKFVKLPKGRVVAVIAGITGRTKRTLEGEMDAWDGFAENALQQVTPVDSMARDIFSPFRDVQSNRTWYGTAIEGRQFENVEPKKRYDESTSSIAVKLGHWLNYSPKKIHYLLDQYSGVIGDFVLPATTKQAERGFLEGNFTLDPQRSNKLSSDFYKLLDKANYAKSDGDETAAYQVRYLNKVRSAVNELYAEKRAIENSDLSNVDKRKQGRVIQALISESFKTAINDYELMTNAIEATQGVDESLRFTEATRLAYGAERALREYNSATYEKAQVLHSGGIGYDAFYNYYFGIRNKNKAQSISYISKMPLTDLQKIVLIFASGYIITSGDFKNYTNASALSALQRHLNSLSISAEEKQAFAKKLGLTYLNGRLTK